MTPQIFAALAALSFVVVAMMIRAGLLDHPVERSSHSVPTPKGGGVGIAAACLAGALVAPGPDRAAAAVPLAGALLLAWFSYQDDRHDFGFAPKLAMQTLAAGCVLLAGWRAADLALPVAGMAPLHLGWAGAVLALGWMLFVTNAVNFIDGLNGLASGCVAIACLAAWLAGAPGVWTLPLVAGVLGFLPWNYPRARIFMGDVGSQFIGVLVAGLAVRLAAWPGCALVVPLAMSPILLDAAVTLLRRARAGERLTQAHRGHFYQVAQRAGVPAAWVAAVYWLLAAWGAWWAILTTASPAFGRAALPVAVLMPVLSWGFWAAWVAARAKRAGLTRW